MQKIGKIICCSVLCIPLIAIIIIAAISGGKNSPNSEKGNNSYVNDSLKKVRILGEDGTLIREYEDNEILELYWNVINNGTEITNYQLVGDEIATSFVVNYVGGVSEDSYTFIMSSDNDANCVYKDINEKIYSIFPDDAKNLLLRDEFSDANKYAKVVDLKLSYTIDSENINQNVAADTYNWSYMRLDGEIATKADNEAAAEPVIVSVPKKAAFDLSFDTETLPETVNVVVSKGTENIYTGEPGALSAYLSFATDTLLDVSVQAKWHESDASNCYGDVNYNFRILYDVPSKFTIADKRLAAGEFTVIKVTSGISTNEVINAQADFMENATESFVYDGVKYIFVPIKPDAAPGNYTIKLREFAGESSVNFQVRQKTFATHDNLLVTPEVATLSTETNIKEHNDFIREVSHNNSSEKLWKDKFILPVANGNTVCSFGDTMKIPGNVKISDGMYISGAAGASVRAANEGVVVFAGETKYGGNTVIIDHGLGVVSYYFNLGGISCSEGDKVTKSSVVGTLGTSGYTPYSNTVLYCNSVGGCFVNPKTQLDYGINFG